MNQQSAVRSVIIAIGLAGIAWVWFSAPSFKTCVDPESGVTVKRDGKLGQWTCMDTGWMMPATGNPEGEAVPVTEQP